MVVEKRLKSECFAPLFTMIWFGAYSKPLSRLSFVATAALRAGTPSTAVYFVKLLLMASIAAS